MSFDLGPCLRGEKAAWDAFVARFSPVIYAAVRRVLRARVADVGREEIEDAAQEVFVRLVRGDFRLLRSFDPGRASLSTWLTVVSRSTALDQLRKRRPEAVPLENVPAPAASGDDPAEASSALPVPRGLLSARQRLVLTMLFERQMSVQQVSAVLGVKQQTVRSAKHKAISRLREHFGGR